MPRVPDAVQPRQSPLNDRLMCGAWQGRVGWGTMRRRFFSAASLLSLVLCVATVVLWVRSHSISDSVSHEVPSPDFGYTVETAWLGEGCLVFASDISGLRSDDPGDGSTSTAPKELWSWRQRGAERHVPIDPPHSIWNRLGFWCEAGDAHGQQWVVPLWFPALLASVLRVLWLFNRLVEMKRRWKGQCLQCFYDLTGNTSGTCPECGSPIPQSSWPA
jgi:hypothetical protein